MSRSDNFLLSLLDTLQTRLGLEVLTDAMAEKITRDIMAEWGGDSPYICKIDPMRSQKVLAAFNGRNRDEVCHTYALSRSQFYSILKGRERE